MTITIVNPALSSVGSADDGDAATGRPCNYGGPGARRCTDGLSLSAASPTSATRITAVAQATSGPAATGRATSNAKGAATASVRVAYSFWERLLRFFGVVQKLKATVDIGTFAFVGNGPNQATFAVFLTGGPPGGTNPIPVFQGAYTFDQAAGNPTMLDVKKDGAPAGALPNPGLYRDTNRGPTVGIEPGVYDLQFEMNAVATADGQVVLGATGTLQLSEA